MAFELPHAKIRERLREGPLSDVRLPIVKAWRDASVRPEKRALQGGRRIGTIPMSSSRSDVFVEQRRVESDRTASPEPETVDEEVVQSPLRHTLDVIETTIQAEQVKADHDVGNNEKEIREKLRDNSPVSEKSTVASHDRRSDTSAQIPPATPGADAGSPPTRTRRRLKTQVIIPSSDNGPGKKTY